MGILMIITLQLLSLVIGYLYGKGEIKIVKKHNLTQEEKDIMAKMQKDQEDALEKYNAVVRDFGVYDSI